MLIGLLGTSQNGFRTPEQEHAIINMFGDYADNKQGGYGFNVGAEFGYSGFIEAKAGFEIFPELYGGYTEIHGAVGFKFVHGYEEQWNYYVGVIAMKVWRTGNDGKAWRTQPGLELQWTYDIGEWFATGFRYTLVKRYDMEIFDWPVKNVNSVYLIMTFKLNKL